MHKRRQDDDVLQKLIVHFLDKQHPRKKVLLTEQLEYLCKNNSVQYVADTQKYVLLGQVLQKEHNIYVHNKVQAVMLLDCIIYQQLNLQKQRKDSATCAPKEELEKADIDGILSKCTEVLQKCDKRANRIVMIQSAWRFHDGSSGANFYQKRYKRLLKRLKYIKKAE